MELNFINGKALIKRGRKTIAKVYDRPIFFNGLKVAWNPCFPYSVEVNGMAAECISIEDAITLLRVELPC
jgi:hypothetical protein